MPRFIPLFVLAGALCAGPAGANVVINEVMPSPHADWSGDARSSAVDDEWVELANAGTEPLDLAAYFVADGHRPGVPRVGFDGTLAPGATRFVTGEHALDWQSANGGAGEGLALDDGADTVTLFRSAGGAAECVDALAWSGSTPDVSWGRWPDAAGTFAAFDALAGGSGPQPTPGGPNGGIAAPKILDEERAPLAPTSADAVRVRARAADADGVAECTLFVRMDGGAVQSLPMTRVEGSPTLGTWERVLPAQPAGRTVSYHVRVSDGVLLAQTNDATFVVAAAGGGVALNEILADPPPDPEGDANGDGVRSSADDEFIEVINHGTTPADLSGWSLADSVAVRHVFPEGLVLPPGAMYVVFGGGTITGIPSGADVASTGGLSLNNTADQVRLLDAGGGVQDAHSYGTEANADQSLIRMPDGDGEWTRPLDAGMPWRYSPGAVNAQPASVEVMSWARIKALYGP